jgi:hypothetical protein
MFMTAESFKAALIPSHPCERDDRDISQQPPYRLSVKYLARAQASFE